MFSISKTLKKYFVFTLIIICVASVTIISSTNIIPSLNTKTAKAFEFSKFLDRCSAATINEYNLSYYGSYNYNPYNSSDVQCDIASTSLNCLIDTCSNGITPDHLTKNCNGYSNYNSPFNFGVYNNSQYCNNYTQFGYTDNRCNSFYYDNCNYNNYNSNFNNTNSCIRVNCLDLAVNELAQKFNSGQSDFTISSDLNSQISNARLENIPVNVTISTKSVNPFANNYNNQYLNTLYISVTTEVKNYNSTIIASSEHIFDNLGVTISQERYQNYNLSGITVGNYFVDCRDNNVATNYSNYFDYNYQYYNQNYLLPIQCNSTFSISFNDRNGGVKNLTIPAKVDYSQTSQSATVI
jgi:hypothetical protein